MSEVEAAIATIVVMSITGTVVVFLLMPRMFDPIDRPRERPERRRRAQKIMLAFTWIVALVATAIAVWVDRFT